MKLHVSWPANTTPSIDAPDDAPPEPMEPHLERLLHRGVPSGARITRRTRRVSRKGHPYWLLAYEEQTTVVRAVLLFIDVVFVVTVNGDVDAITGALDESDLDFDDEVASLHQFFQGTTS